jgi:two-component system response regulator AtoC
VKRALVVDDDRRTRRILQIVLERLGLDSVACESAEDALRVVERESVTIVLTDLKMPRMNGIEFMRALRAHDADVPVVVLTAYGTVEAAVEAMKLGAVDFLAKPFDVDALEILVRRSIESRKHRADSRFLRQQSGDAPAFENLIGRSPVMQEVFELIRRAAPARSAVLITGETGTGKEMVARAIHNQSPRQGELFVPLNCAAIPGELLESELFGHVRGAFSGAESPIAWASSRPPTAGRSSSTRSATWISASRRSCCASSRKGWSSRWAATGASPSTSASCHRPTGISSGPWPTGRSGRISTTAST